MGVRASEDGRVLHIWQSNIVHKIAPTRQKAQVFLSLESFTNPFPFFLF
jgi:hypothetical protein